MPAYYFVKIPKLPPELSHQMGSVQMVRYATKEKDRIEKGQTIAIVENWWARMALKSVGPGYVNKTFFEPHTHIHEGDPIAIVLCDPEDCPKTETTCEIEVVSTIRQRPAKKK